MLNYLTNVHLPIQYTEHDISVQTVSINYLMKLTKDIYNVEFPSQRFPAIVGLFEAPETLYISTFYNYCTYSIYCIFVAGGGAQY